MKVCTSRFKNDIKLFGKELDSKITYTINEEEIELGAEVLNSVSLHYQGSILKSVMKQLDIDSNVEIPLGTILKYQFGLKIDEQYEYITYGNYIVYNVEKQEDTNSYKIICYDKLLYTMIPYENIGVAYPITIKNYINAICTYLGLNFANMNNTFVNCNREIPNELYLSSDGTSLDYTFRDVLDELAQVTASTICINNDDELEIRYITDTNNTIDEEYLKDVNVNFGEKFGPINTIVLSRSAGSDNIYYPEQLPEDTYELKISDNQIMNGNNRDEFLPDIYEKLNGLEYYTNDFASPGICYYELCDRYNVEIGGKTYSCVMFNDEINVTQGLEENVYTKLPEETQTDYIKADKTDRKINQTYLIVDKQNQLIQSLIDKSVYISNTLNSIGSITLENAYKGRLYELSIKGQISLSYPQNDNLYGSSLVPRGALVPTAELLPSSSVPYQNEVKYPNSDLYPIGMILLIDDKEYSLNIDFLNYISNDVCDEFIYHDGEYKVIRRVGINDEGNKYALDNEFIDNIGYIDLNVDTNSVIRLKSFGNGIYKTTYLLDNQYTDVFATKVELNSTITQTAEQINAEVNAKVDEDEIIAKLNLGIRNGQGVVELKGNAVLIDSDNFKLDEIGKIEATAGDIAGFEINNEEGFVKEIYAPYDYTQEDLDRIYEIYRGRITPTQEDYEKYDINQDGIINVFDYVYAYWFYKQGVTSTNPSKFVIDVPYERRLSGAKMGYVDGYGNFINGITYNGAVFNEIDIKGAEISGTEEGYSTTIRPDQMIFYTNNETTSTISMFGSSGNITCISLTQTSLEENKKNFEKYNGALEEVLKTDIYKYNLKFEKDTDKKHLGFVIGDNYNYSSEITSLDKNGNEIGVDNYAMTSLCLQAIKEQQEIIQKLEKRIKKLEESDN